MLGNTKRDFIDIPDYAILSKSTEFGKHVWYNAILSKCNSTSNITPK